MANNTIQFKRTSTSGLLPNTTNSSNNAYIPAGSFAVNLTDKKVIASDGSLPFEVGANVTNQIVTGNLILANNATQIKFATVNSSAYAYMTQQNDDNFVFYSTNTSYGSRPVWSIFANNNSSNFKFAVRAQFDGGISISSGQTLLDSTGSQGAAGQVLTSNGTGNVYWSSSGGGLSAGNGLSSNTTAYFVLPNTGIIANSTGTFVNAAYIATISANNTTYVNGKTESNLNVNSAATATNANNTTYLNGQLASYYTNATNITTGTLPWAQAPSGTVNTSGTFTFSGVETFNANVVIAGNSTSQLLISTINATSNGVTLTNNLMQIGNTSVYTNVIPGSVYTTNLYGTLQTTSQPNITANNSNYLGGTAASGYQTTAGLAANVATLTSNSTSFVGTVSAANVVSNTQLQANLANYTPNTTVYSTFAQNTAIYAYAASNAYVNSTFQTTAGLASNVATLTSNNTTYINGKTEANLNVNSAVNATNANNATYLGGTTASGYQTTAGLSANVATLTANNTTYVNGKTEGNLNVNSAATATNANNASYLGGTAAAGYQTTAGLSANVLTLAANSSTYSNASVSNTFTVGTASYFVANGNVGIGASSPSAKLQIEQDQATYSYFDFYNNTAGGGVVWRQIFRNIANTGITTVDFAKLLGGGFAINNNDTAAANFTSFNVGASERMRINSAGQVGIGTSNPQRLLHVGGGSVLADSLGSIGQYDMVYGAASTWYNAGWRNDGYSVYLLGSSVQTTQASAFNASWNNYRPFAYNLGTGAVSIDVGSSLGGTTIGGTLGVNGNAYFAGTIYDNSNTAYYLKPSSTSVLNTLALGGQTSAPQGSIWTGGEIWMAGDNKKVAWSVDSSTDSTPNVSLRATTSASGDLIVQNWSGSASNDNFWVIGATREARCAGNITAYYSDQRLKTKTGTIQNALSKVMSLEGFTYIENEVAKSHGYNNDKQQVGVSAQDIQAVLPEAVSLAPFDIETLEDGTITSKSGENFLTVDYSRLTPLLIEAIKEQQTYINTLEDKINLILQKLEDK